MHRALLGDGILDDYAASYSHTERCEAVLAEGLTDLEKDVVDVMLRRKSVDCRGTGGRI